MKGVLALVLTLVACSASEDANRGVRCDRDTPCPGALRCYRNFCIPHEVPHEVVEAGVTTPPALEASVPVDATTDVAPADVDVQVPTTPEDAGGEPPALEDAGAMTLDAEAAPPDAETVPPEVDGGPAIDDAGRASSAALLVCLPTCSNRTPACLRCLSGVLASNPTLCSDANAEVEPVVAALCDYLCTNAACKGQP